MSAPVQKYHGRQKNANAIANQIQTDLRDGRLSEGQRLPSVRSLARTLRVSPVTVSAAYAKLAARGVIHGDRRRGTIVNRRPTPIVNRIATPVPPGVLDLANGNADPELLPALSPILARLDASTRRYPEHSNLPELIALAARQFDSDRICSDSITVTAGGMDAIERVLQAHLRPGDLVAVEDPGYVGVLDLISALGLRTEPVPIDDFGFLPKALALALERGIKAIVLTPRAQNPLGAALDQRRVSQLLDLLRDYPDVLIIEDDHAGPVAGVPALTLCHPAETRAQNRSWAVVRSVSKSLGPDLRLAVVAGDPDTIAHLDARMHLGPRWTSHLLQEIVVRLWSDPNVAVQLQFAAAGYAARRDALIPALAHYGLEGHARSGLNVWVPIREGMIPEADAVQYLLAKGWLVRAGAAYRTNSAPGLRVTTAALRPVLVPRLASDIHDAVWPPRHGPLSHRA